MDKADEMEKNIDLKVAGWTRGYTTLFLTIWSVYNYIHTRDPGLPFLLLISQSIISDGIKRILKWRIRRDKK